MLPGPFELARSRFLEGPKSIGMVFLPLLLPGPLLLSTPRAAFDQPAIINGLPDASVATPYLDQRFFFSALALSFGLASDWI